MAYLHLYSLTQPHIELWKEHWLERGLSSREIKVILENLIQGVLPPWGPEDYQG